MRSPLQYGRVQLQPAPCVDAFGVPISITATGTAAALALAAAAIALAAAAIAIASQALAAAAITIASQGHRRHWRRVRRELQLLERQRLR